MATNRGADHWKLWEDWAAGYMFCLWSAGTLCSLCQKSLLPFLFSSAFWWCFILNYSIKLTRSLWVGFGSLLLTCQTLLGLNHKSPILIRELLTVSIFPFLPGVCVYGWVVADSFPVILILPSDFTRSPWKVRSAAVTPGMLLEHYSAMRTFNT